MSAQDEIKQRLEVAQLYEEMGQLPKATRYYVAAAETALKGKLFDRGRELLNKALDLDPDNAQAKTYLEKLDKHLASLGVAVKPSGKDVAPARPAAAAGSGGVTVPTPALYLRSEQISAILSQVSSAPNQKFFPYTPLPRIDMHAIEEKNRKLEAAKEAERAKERTAVESAFGNSQGGFSKSGSTSGFLNQAQRSGRKRDKPEESQEEEKSSEGRRKRRRGANKGLADSIRKRLQGG
jgi:tetratricopeptide (TPR) repeat protein